MRLTPSNTINTLTAGQDQESGKPQDGGEHGDCEGVTRLRHWSSLQNGDLRQSELRVHRNLFHSSILCSRTG